MQKLLDNIQLNLNSIPTMISSLKATIGTDSTNRLLYTIVKSMGVVKEGVFDFIEDGTNKEIPSYGLNNNACFAHSKLLLKGLTQHVKNPQIFFSIAPKQKNAYKYLQRVREFTKQSGLNIVVLSEQPHQILTPYLSEFEASESYSQQRKFLKYKPSKTEGSLKDTIYDIEYNDKIGIDQSKGLEQLYRIYQETLGNYDNELKATSPKPILFQSHNGSKAAVLAFAYDLYARFNSIFTGSMNNTVNSLKNAFNDLRRSFSPIALANPDEVKDAIVIAIALKIKEYEFTLLQKVATVENGTLKQEIETQLTPAEKIKKIEDFFTNKKVDINKSKGLQFFEPVVDIFEKNSISDLRELIVYYKSIVKLEDAIFKLLNEPCSQEEKEVKKPVDDKQQTEQGIVEENQGTTNAL